MIRVVVFDCDGVLLESVDAKTRAFEQVVEPHGPEAVKLLRDYHLAHGGVSRVEKFRHFHREVLGREPQPEEMDDLCSRFVEHSLQNVLCCDEVPGARACLEALHGKLPLYVASGAPQDELRMVLARRGLDGFFAGVYGSPAKKPVILRDVLEQTGAGPGETLMVGDSSTDLEAAQAVGTLFYGRGRFPEPLPWGEDLSGLCDFIRQQD
ncbi:HAD family hydrolase [Salidesulfovibrio brasiliensis]|uniref:HAD family hydrolase n=1 Tax=Salidesulfovibrio brasiliensis TaxID=221711 RepID=UPI0006D290C3|nr:HAD family hydrolase [Salidesulfovibrio brasiliensis]